MMFLVLLSLTLSTTTYDIMGYTLGTNMVVNPEFELPDLGNSASTVVTTIPGWNCNQKC